MRDGPKTVLLALDPGLQAAPALRYGVALARQWGAVLAVHIVPPALKLPRDRPLGAAPQYLEEEKARIAALCEKTAAIARAAAAEAGIGCEIAGGEGSPFESKADRLVHLARVADICVIDAPGREALSRRPLVEGVLFESGRPVLVVPAHAAVQETPRRIAIAWDGSLRAARAVKDALALLKRATAVFVVTVSGEKDLSLATPSAGLAAYLERHGVVEPRFAALTAEGGDVAGRLRGFVREEEIDLMVMGAYVRSPLREAILGGVTRSFLDDAPAALLMAH